LVLIALLVLLLVADNPTCNLIGQIGVIASLVLLITGINSACPECKKWWARIYLERRILKRERCFGLVTRYAYSSSTGSVSRTSTQLGSIHQTNHGGTVHTSGTTDWQERVPVIRTTFELHYQCKYCEAKWTKVEAEEVEDFERA
jgi:hypothetical protein